MPLRPSPSPLPPPSLSLLLLPLLFLVLPASPSPISRPVRSDRDLARVLDYADSHPSYSAPDAASPPSPNTTTYHERSPLSPGEAAAALKTSVPKLATHVGHGAAACPLELEVLWSTQLGASVYATPILRESMFGEASMHVVVPTFVRYLELIDAAEGLAPLGWPL